MRTLARKIDWHHLALQGTLFIGVGAVWSYGAVLMLSRGLSNSAVGVVTCVAQLLPMVLQGFTARACEGEGRMTPRRMILLLSAVTIALLVITCCFPQSLWLVIAAFIVVAVVLNLIIPLINIMIVPYILRGVDINYGFGRSAGSFGYALSSAVLGFVLEGRDAILIVPVMAASLALQMVAAYTFRYSLPEGDEAVGEGSVSAVSRMEVLRSRPDFTVMLIALSLLIGVHNVNNVFMVHVIRRIGGAESWLGIVIGISSGMEVVGMPFCRRLRGKLGIGGVMRLSALFYVVRVLSLLLSPSPVVLCLTSLLQALQCGLMLPAVVYYVADILPPQWQSHGQSLMHLFPNCFAPAIVSLLAGVVLDHWGVNTALSGMLVCTLIGAALVWLATRKKK